MSDSFAAPWIICSLPGSSVPGISQARIQVWISISFSRGSSWPRDWTHISCISRQIVYHWATWEAHLTITEIQNKTKYISFHLQSKDLVIHRNLQFIKSNMELIPPNISAFPATFFISVKPMPGSSGSYPVSLQVIIP